MALALSEERRLQILRRYAVLDTPPEEAFDRIVRMAMIHFRVPIATVTFVDEARQWFKAVHGLDVRETGRDIAFCHHTIQQDEVMVVPDAATDPRFATNPLVVMADPGIRFYAGAPIVSPDGVRLGTVSIIDRKPRPGLNEAGRQVLRDLAAVVGHELEMRLASSSFIKEIEERKRAEAVLKLTTDRFRLALVHSPVVLMAQDRDLRYVWAANLPAPLTLDSILGRTDAELWSEDAAAEIVRAKRQVMESGTATRRDLSLMLNGALRTFDTSIEPLWDETGAAMGITAAAVDVTERRKAKDKLKAALAEAERASRAKAQFFASASHDLRQPFQALLLFHDVLAASSLDHKQRASLGHMRQAIAAGQELLTALLDISTLEAGVVQSNATSVPVGEVLRELTDQAGAAATARGLRFRWVPCSARVSTDPVLLCRIVRNLLDNAVKYTREGGILLGCRRQAESVWIEVWDSGPGIPAEKLDEIFEEFVQLDNSERDRAKGLGLGLAIVKRTADLLGHRVLVHSRPGRGSCFRIGVPRAPRPE